MAQFSLRQALADIGPSPADCTKPGGLPAGFDPINGIRSLFPPGTTASIKELASYHLHWSGSVRAGAVNCIFVLDVWGSGKYHFSGIIENNNFFGAAYEVAFALLGSEFQALQGSVGYLQSGYFSNCIPSNQWLSNNWPQALTSQAKVRLSVVESP
jgi:hypothetical protein